MLQTQHSTDHSAGRRLELPQTLRDKLADFRRYVRTTKLAETVLCCFVIGSLAFLTIYASDRFWDTHRAIRWLLFCLATFAWILIPYSLYRWVWCNQRWEQVARLLRKRAPSIGDEILSVIELSASDSEQARSPSLCLAAIQQVAERTKGRDLRAAAPPNFLKSLWMLTIAGAAMILGLVWLYPLAAQNAWTRFSSPWSPAARYTFTSVIPLPDQFVVPHGEPATMTIQLEKHSARIPDQASVRLGSLPVIIADLVRPETSELAPVVRESRTAESSNHEPSSHVYHFELPPQVVPVSLEVSVGDYFQSVTMTPKMRPELTGLMAQVTLPEYLQRRESLEVDARAGIVSVVEGSLVQLQASASQELEGAWIAERSVPTRGSTFFADPISVGTDDIGLVLDWQDSDGLKGRVPFSLEIRPFPDEAPSIAAQDLPRQAVILESEQINFRALAADDFGVRRVGIAWKGLDGTLVAKPADGQKVIAAGDPDQAAVQIPATFCAAALGIAAQPLEVTLWVEDYLPGRSPVHSAPHLLYVLTADEHAIWITSQISKWHRSALDVRDAELQLYQANERLRASGQTEQSNQGYQDSLRRQAALEEANSRKLNSLTQSGTDLLRQAARNPDVTVENLDQLARMIDVLQDIAGSRMPSVADLLKLAAAPSESLAAELPGTDLQAEGDSSQTSQSQAEKDAPQVGQVRSNARPGTNEADDSAADDANADSGLDQETPGLSVPSLADIESDMHSPDALAQQQASASEQKPSSENARFGLPQTTLIGPSQNSEDSQENSGDESKSSSPDKPAEGKPLEQALQEQAELLAEFEKIAEQLNAVLANLEGSTLVKRLKAASREQILVAEKIASRIESVFGRSRAVSEEDRTILTSLTEAEQQSSQTVSYIMDDLQAYYERRKLSEVKAVLDEMKSSEVLLALKKLGDDLIVEHGLSIAQAEYWADTLDRWAEDLVESSDSVGDDSSSESKDSLPPSFVLEMLRILEGEVNLREETRVAQQAGRAIEADEHLREATRLAGQQAGLKDRTNKLTEEIALLPGASENFAQELHLFSAVSHLMDEARLLLSLGNTGSQTVAAQTEVIELLLQSKRVNPQGGGGGGQGTPGTGGSGTTEESALALIGAGLNPQERQEARDVGQGVGRSSDRVFPEEFRGGLDAYFQKLETKSN